MVRSARWKTLMVAHDFSECASRAWQLALQLADLHGARLVLVHVTTLPEEDTNAKATPASQGAKPKDDTASGAGAKKKKEREGVFVVRDGIATFRPVKVGVAGDEYFEVLDGLRGGETIVAGTYQAIRDLKDGAKVKEAKPEEGKDGKSKPEEKRS